MTRPPEPSEPEDGSDEDDYCVRVSGSVNDEVRGSALVSLYLRS